MAAFGTSMRFEIQLRIVGDDNNVISEDTIPHLDKGADRLEAIGLSLADAKAVLAGIQGGVVTAQAASFLGAFKQTTRKSHRLCEQPHNSQRFQADSDLPISARRKRLIFGTRQADGGAHF